MPLLSTPPTTWFSTSLNPCPNNANGRRFEAWDALGALLASDTYYSTGGGFVVKEGETPTGSQ
ncbi:MAG: Serine dehydratase beta chain [Bacteroidota bacterium]|jgi:hypothetical protein